MQDGLWLMNGGFWIIVALFVLLLIYIPKGLKIVRQGEECTVERLGEYYKTLRPGLHFIIPFIFTYNKPTDMREQVIDVPSQAVITRDNAMIDVDGVLFYQILDACKARYEVADLRLAIENLIMTNIRTVMGSMDLDELLSQRDVINQRILDVVDKATDPWGVKITRVEIKDITPPQDIFESMARQTKAERDKRAQILEAEGLKQSQILKSEGEREAAVLKAEAEKEAAFREAEARERLAEADAKATELVSDAIAKGNIQAVNYFIGTKYIDALQALAKSNNEKVLILPMETTQVLGSLSGIGELVKETMKK